MAFTTTTAAAILPFKPSLSPTTCTCLLKASNFKQSPQQQLTPSNIIITRRRIATIAAVNTLLLSKYVIFNTEMAYGLDFRITVPDQTAEEAESVLKEHVEDLMEVKALLSSELWRDAQKTLRKSSSLLKQDIYTLIQAKPGSERSQLRNLYSQLFNTVTRLDYAARSKDGSLCHELFDNVVTSLDAILSKLQPP